MGVMGDRKEDEEVQSLLASPPARTSHPNQAISPTARRAIKQESDNPSSPLTTSSTTPQLSLARRLTFPSMILNILLIVALWIHTNTTTSIRHIGTSTASVRDKEPMAPSIDTISKLPVTTASLQGNFVNDTIIPTYGHVHMAKTAGTEINGYLAARYERICGHKGYSYDAYQFNLRVKQAQEQTGKKGLSVIGTGDIISRQRKGWNRGRVPHDVMKEIGFEDCDWISVELTAFFWYNDTNWPIPKPLELHVPCRDPVNHLMSQCNHKRKRFDCNAEDIGAEVEKCLLFIEQRFNLKLTRAPNVRVKCFNPIPIEPYLDYMHSKLQGKRIPAEFIHRETNTARNKSQECIWKNNTVREEVLKILLKLDYYKFCQECKGGSGDLLAFS